MSNPSILLSRLASKYGYDTTSSVGAQFRQYSDGTWARYFVATGVGGGMTLGPAHYNWKRTGGGRGGDYVLDAKGERVPIDGVTVVPGLEVEPPSVEAALEILVADTPEPDARCLSDLAKLAEIGARYGRPRSPSSHIGLRLTSFGGGMKQSYTLDDGCSSDLIFAPGRWGIGTNEVIVRELLGVKDDAPRALDLILAYVRANPV